MIQGTSLRNKQIQLSDQNPYTVRNYEGNELSVKITIADVPLSFDNKCIEEHLRKKFVLEFVSEIKYQYERTAEGKLTNYKNGNRFIFAKGPMVQPLSRQDEIGNFKCRYFHGNQFCNETCNICETKGHKAGNKQCEHFIEKQKIKTVMGHTDILSNFPLYTGALSANLQKCRTCLLV